MKPQVSKPLPAQEHNRLHAALYDIVTRKLEYNNGEIYYNPLNVKLSVVFRCQGGGSFKLSVQLSGRTS